jgi:hypothetical protein
MNKLNKRPQRQCLIYIVMWRFIPKNRMHSTYEKYVMANDTDEVGTFDWFVYYVKENKEFRKKWLGF